MNIVSVFGAILAALLWGVTNPFLKQGGSGIEGITKSNVVLQFFAEIKFLFLNWRYLVPFLLNQSGSLVFYLALASGELSLVVPVTNALTFFFTTLTETLYLKLSIEMATKTEDVMIKDEGEVINSPPRSQSPEEFTTVDEVQGEHVLPSKDEDENMAATLAAMQNQIKLLQQQVLVGKKKKQIIKDEEKSSVEEGEIGGVDQGNTTAEEDTGDGEEEDYYRGGDDSNEEEEVIQEEVIHEEEEYEGDEHVDEEKETLEEVEEEKTEGNDFFDSLMSQYDLQAKTSPAVQSKLAALVKKLCQEPISSDKQKELYEKYSQPANLMILKDTTVNKEVWDMLHNKYKTQDVHLKRVQVSMMKGLTALTLLTDDIMKKKDLTPENMLGKLTDAIALIGAANQKLNASRRQIIRPTLPHSFQPLCNTNVEDDSMQLFGKNFEDKAKIARKEMLKKQEEANKGGFSRGRGFRGSFRGRPFVPRGRGSERGGPSFRGTGGFPPRGGAQMRGHPHGGPRGGFIPRGRGERKREYRGGDGGPPPPKKGAHFNQGNAQNPRRPNERERSDPSGFRRNDMPIEVVARERDFPHPPGNHKNRDESGGSFSSLNERFGSYNQGGPNERGNYPGSYPQNY